MNHRAYAKATARAVAMAQLPLPASSRRCFLTTSRIRTRPRTMPSPCARKPATLSTLTAASAGGPRAFSATASPRSQASPPTDSSKSELLKTPLYDYHASHGAKMVPFAGYSMPVLYSNMTLTESHLFTRKNASLFDVSHMVQHRFSGPGAAAFLETLCPSGIADLQPMRSTLTTFLWPETGGIVDDAIVARLAPDEFYVVTNGACRDKDIEYFQSELAAFAGNKKHSGDAGSLDVKRTTYQSGLLALQGPLSAAILGEVLADPNTDLEALHFGSCAWATLKLRDGTTTSPLLISRGGYTGEDGFEIAVAPSPTLTADVTAVADTLLTVAGPERLQLAGLGPRDSLRLEAGMCLYGHDLDDETTPVEAGLSWIIPSRRRQEGGFHGSERVLRQVVPESKGGDGVAKRRVGLVLEPGPGPAAREGATIRGSCGGDCAGKTIGRVTSGMPSPTLGTKIAMAYVRHGFHKAGTEVEVDIRGKPKKAVVIRMPFVPTKYWKGQSEERK